MNSLKIKNKRSNLILENKLVSKTLTRLLIVALTPFYYCIGYLVSKYALNSWSINAAWYLKIAELTLLGVLTLVAIALVIAIGVLFVLAICACIYYALIVPIVRMVYEIKFTKVIQYLPISQDEISKLNLEDYTKYEAYLLNMFSQLSIKFPNLIESCFENYSPKQLVSYLNKSIDSHATMNHNKVFTELLELSITNIYHRSEYNSSKEIVPYKEFINKRAELLAKTIISKSFVISDISKHATAYKEDLDECIKCGIVVCSQRKEIRL